MLLNIKVGKYFKLYAYEYKKMDFPIYYMQLNIKIGYREQLYSITYSYSSFPAEGTSD